LAEPAARTVCFVEIEAYACAILAARMAENALDPAPVWTNLRTFDGKPWRGTVDCITAG
jgi:DNA (cytosine-5)-methyltransferase 1